MAGGMVYRLRASSFNDGHMVRFATAMRRLQAIRDNRGYAMIAGFHGAPYWYCWHHQYNQRSPVRAQLFLPWHRAYLYHLEQAIQDQVNDDEGDVALPWWNWTVTRGIPQSYDDAVTPDGQLNPLERFRMDLSLPTGRIRRFTRRSPGANWMLPSQWDVEQLLQDRDWSSFSDRVQDMHDRIHGWVGGDMGDPTTAAFDPLFFAHHCMIDRLWYMWQIRHGQGNIPAALLDYPLDPFGMTVRGTLDVLALGYEYADQAFDFSPFV